MDIYIAAPWTHRDQAREAARQCDEAGHSITRPWWDCEAGDEETEKLAELAWFDMLGVLQCDALIILNYAKSEGKAVETGLALGLKLSDQGGPRIFLIGPKSNIFHNMAFFEKYETLEEVLEVIKGEPSQMR